MSNSAYQLYLQSLKWGYKRQGVWNRCNGKCERCGHITGNRMQDCHHLTYKNLYNEPLEDLQGVCRGCHEFISGKSPIDPLNPRSPSIEELRRRVWDF